MLNWKKALPVENDNNSIIYTIPNNWLYIHYYEAFVLMFRIENAMRIFVYSVLKAKYNNKWVNQEVFEKTIKDVANERITRDIQHGYIGLNITCPIMHLTLGELTYLAFKNWESFAEYFPGDKKIMEYKMQEITNVRNSIAHFRPINESDLDLIKLNTKHVLVIIDGFIENMLRCNIKVPSNTNASWYHDFSKFVTFNQRKYIDMCRFKVSEDENQKWISINLTYDCKILSQGNLGDDFLIYNLLNIHTSNLIKKCPRLLKNCIYISETVQGYPHLIEPKAEENKKFPYSKSINFLFKTSAIESEYKNIFYDLYKIVKKIDIESKMITDDSNARGEFVQCEEVFAYSKKDEDGVIVWTMNDDKLLTRVKENDPPEFWGNFDFINNFITNAHNYPWMGTEISNRSRWDE